MICSKDILFLIAEQLEHTDMINFTQTSKTIYSKLWTNEYFRYRLWKRYPLVDNIFFNSAIPTLISIEDEVNEIDIFTAIKDNDITLVQALLSKGININQVKKWCNPIGKSIIHDRKNIFNFLISDKLYEYQLEKGYDTLVIIPDEQDNIYNCILYKRLDMLKTLIEKCDRLDLTEYLIEACDKNNTSIVKLLLDLSLKYPDKYIIDIEFNKQFTLAIALIWSKMSIINMLLNYGFDLYRCKQDNPDRWLVAKSKALEQRDGKKLKLLNSVL